MDKVCYIIRCDFKRKLWIDNKMPTETITEAFVADQEIEIAGEKYICLSQFITFAKKFYALDIVEKYKESLKGRKFSYGKAVGYKAESLKVTTPKNEGYVTLEKD